MQLLSSIIETFEITKCGIHAIRIPMDELSAHEGVECEEYYSDVGHISRQ